MIKSKVNYDPVEDGSYSDASAPSLAEVDPNCMSLREILQYSLRGQDPSGFFGIGNEQYELKSEKEEEVAIDNDIYSDLPGSFAEALEEINHAQSLAYAEMAARKDALPKRKAKVEEDRSEQSAAE